MALETVRITVNSDDLSPELVNDVVVRVFDATGTTLITEATTGEDQDGVAEMTLNGAVDDGTRYQLRFFIHGGRISQPQYIDVIEGSTNNFEITAHVFGLPESPDNTLCRCSGVVRGPNGVPRRGIDIHFIPVATPVMVNDALLLGERVAVRTDSSGYVEVDLFRDTQYSATVESHEDVLRQVMVPDAAAVNIGHLLFPIVSRVELEPEGPYTLAVDETLQIVPTILTSSGVELAAPADEDVQWYVDDTTVASVVVLSDRIEVRGISPGSTTLQVKRRDESIKYSPDLDIAGGNVAITVY